MPPTPRIKSCRRLPEGIYVPNFFRELTNFRNTPSICFIEAVAKKSEGSGAGFQTALTQVGCRPSEIDLRFLSQHCGIGMTSVSWTNAKKISGRGSILAPKTHFPLVIIARH